MDDFLKMDIFFAVATASVVVVAVFTCIVLVHLSRFLRTLDRIALEVEGEAEAIREDLHDMRRDIRREGLRLAHWFSFFGKTAKRHRTPVKKEKT